MKHKRIILTGAHGTGKTTVLEYFDNLEYPVITEVVRKLNKEGGIKINEQGDQSGQQAIFNAYYELLKQPKYVSDRGLTDVVAYTKYLVDHGNIDAGVLESQLDQLKKFHEENPDILYCFFPIEFDIEDDNVRSTDQDFQQDISNNIRWVISYLATETKSGIEWIAVHGTPEERFDQILQVADPEYYLELRDEFL